MFGKKIIGLDINETYLKAVLMSKTGDKYKLLAINKVNVPPNTILDGQIKNKEKFIECLTNLLKSANPAPIKVKRVVCSLPGTKIFIHSFLFKHDFSEKEIEEALPNETEKIIPLPYAQTYADYQNIKDDEKTAVSVKKRIIYAAISKTIAEEYLEALEACELTADFFCLTENSLTRSLISETSKNKPILIIEAGTDLFRLIVVDNGGVQEIQHAMVNKQMIHSKIAEEMGITEDKVQELKEIGQIKEAVIKKVLEPILKNIVLTAKDVIKKYKEVSSKKIEEVILGGEMLDTPGLVLYLINNLAQKVEVGNPWKEVLIMSNYFNQFQDREETGQTRAVVFANAVGLAKLGILPPGEHEINIIPQRITENRKKRRKGFYFNLIAIFLIFFSCLNLLGFSFTFGKLYFEWKKVNKANKIIENITSGTRYQELKTDILNFNQEVDLLLKLQRDTFSVPKILEEIKNFIPSKITLTSIEYDDKALIVDITGIAPRREDVLLVQESLQKIPFAKSIYSPLSNLDQQKDISFVVNVQLDVTKLPVFGSKKLTTD